VRITKGAGVQEMGDRRFFGIKQIEQNTEIHQISMIRRNMFYYYSVARVSVDD
jgi:hypothetical protein